jgi:hypothetical protein
VPSALALALVQTPGGMSKCLLWVIRPLADLYRRDQRGVGADESALADQRLVLEEAVVVAGDGAGAEIGVGADMGVADIGEMVDLGARL